MGHRIVEGCVFCCEAGLDDGLENLIVFRGDWNFIILNRFPYTSGHLMIVPFHHSASIEDLNPAIRQEMMELTNQALRVLREEYHPHGFNIGVNIGEAGGAGILDHVHLHIVPRWDGDTNFMSALGQTRVLPETLEDTFIRVKHRWEEDFHGGSRKG
jgi:ATP adenylyltransferase